MIRGDILGISSIWNGLCLCFVQHLSLAAVQTSRRALFVTQSLCSAHSCERFDTFEGYFHGRSSASSSTLNRRGSRIGGTVLKVLDIRHKCTSSSGPSSNPQSSPVSFE